MRILADTQVLVWTLVSSHRLSPSARRILASMETELLVSPVSVFEIALKHRIGKLPGMASFVADPNTPLRRLRSVELPVRHEHALLAGAIPSLHKDPFDRLLAAQAIIEGIPLLSSDAFMTSLGAETLW